MYYAYPTYLTCMRYIAHICVRATLICLYPDWLYQLRAVGSRHLVVERESSLIFRGSNPVTRSCPDPSPSLFSQLLSSTLIRGHGLPFRRASFILHALRLGNDINSLFLCQTCFSRSETTLFIHSANRTHVACVAKNRTPRRRDDSSRNPPRDPRVYVPRLNSASIRSIMLEDNI